MPEALAAMPQRLRIAELAALLPPTPHILLECRLAGGQQRVDLSQLAAGAERTWLEYDLDRAPADAQAAPARFLGAGDDYRVVPLAQGLGMIERLAVEALDNEQARFLQAAAAAVPVRGHGGMRLGALGYMAARRPPALRLNLAPADWEALHAFLLDGGMAPAPESLREAFRIGTEHFSTPVACVDFSPRLTPRVGLELFLLRKEEARLPAGFLDWLEMQGACSKAKRQALERYPLTLTPPKAKRDWPEDLLLQSLAAPEDCFGTVVAFVNHIKLVIEPDRPLQAKAYLAYNHVFTNSAGSAAPSPNGAPAAAPLR